MTTVEDYKDNKWVKDFAGFFGLTVEDVKLVYQVFLGNRVKDWPHPFGELEPWIDTFDAPETKSLRDEIVREKGWNWDRVGVNVLQNEIYRRIPQIQGSYRHLKDVIQAFKEKSVPGRLSFLDYGCGTANLVEHLLEIPEIDFTLTDINPILVDYCRHKLKDHAGRVRCELIPTKEQVTGDRCRVRTRRRTVFGRYDVIHVMDVLEHTLNPLVLLIQMIRSLKPNGLLIFIFPDDIEGDWHTPEANFLRAYCLGLVARLFTQKDDLVWQKSGDPRLERKLLCRATLHDWLAYPKAKRFAKRYFRDHPPPKRDS